MTAGGPTIRRGGPPRVAVIGAGPAGGAAAILLARKGYAVTLVERQRFPRVKVCGEYISPAGTEALEAVLPPEDLAAAGARRCTVLALECGGRSVERRTPPAWVLSRMTLDALLADRARGAGAEVVQPGVVREVEYPEGENAGDGGDGGGGAWRPVRVRLADRGLAAEFVVHADGSGRLDPAGRVPEARGVLGHKCHVRLDALPERERRGVRMRAGAGAYVGTVAVEGGLATLALVAGAGLLKAERGDADAMAARLWPAFRPEWRATAWKTSAVPRSGYIEPGHAASVRLGNAAAAVDPVGGEGIGLALWSAWVFCAALPPGDAWTPGALAHAKARLAGAYRRRLRWRRPACRLAAETLMRPRLVHAAWPAIAAAMGPWSALSGKRAGGRGGMATA